MRAFGLHAVVYGTNVFNCGHAVAGVLLLEAATRGERRRKSTNKKRLVQHMRAFASYSHLVLQLVRCMLGAAAGWCLSARRAAAKHCWGAPHFRRFAPMGMTGFARAPRTFVPHIILAWWKLSQY